MKRNSVDIKDANFLKIYWKLHGSNAAVAGLQKISADLLRLSGPVLLQKVIDQITLVFNATVVPIEKVSRSWVNP